MFHLLKKTVQPIKILFNSNKNNVIKPSTIPASSIPNRQKFLFSNKMNINCSKRIHNGLTLQDMQRKNVSKSFSPFNIPAHLSKVGEAVEKKDIYSWTKPEKSLLKHLTATLSSNNNKNPVLGEHQTSDSFLCWVAVGLAAYFLWRLNRSPSDFMSQFEEFKKLRDEKVKTATIELEFWTVYGDLGEEIGKILIIYNDLKKTKMGNKLMDEMDTKPKEEWNPEFRHIFEKLEPCKKRAEEIVDILNGLNSYGSRFSSERKKQEVTPYVRHVLPKIKEFRQDFEEIKSLIQNLNIQDFDNEDTETKNCKCS